MKNTQNHSFYFYTSSLFVFKFIPFFFLFITIVIGLRPGGQEKTINLKNYYIWKIIFLIFREFIFLKKIISKYYDQQNIEKTWKYFPNFLVIHFYKQLKHNICHFINSMHKILYSFYHIIYIVVNQSWKYLFCSTSETNK